MQLTQTKTNQLAINIDRKKLSQDFVIIRFKHKKGYFLQGAGILDNIPNLPQVKSITIREDDQDKSLYALFDKAQFNTVHIPTFLLRQGSDAENITYEIIDQISGFNKLPDHIICQLLINSLASPKGSRYSFNNLTGHFYIVHPEHKVPVIKPKVNQPKTKQVVALQVVINRHSCLEINVKTFTNIYFKNRLSFSKKRPYTSYPKYALEFITMSMKRLPGFSDQKEDDDQELFIIKQFPGKKNNITFIDFGTFDKFQVSKCGTVSTILKLIKQELNRYLFISFKELSPQLICQYNSKNTALKKVRIGHHLSYKKINIADVINDAESQELVLHLSNTLRTQYPTCTITQKSRIQKSSFNFRLIHDKEFYEHNNLSDSYQVYNKVPVNHLNLYELKKIKDSDDLDKKETKRIKAIADTLIKEVIIKYDIIQGNISITDWKAFGIDGVYIFASKMPAEEKETIDQYCFLEIDTTGKLNFSLHKKDTFLGDSRYDEIAEYFEDDNTVEGIVIDPLGNINAIKRTDIITLPEIVKIGHILEKQAQKYSFKKSELIAYLKECRPIDKIKPYLEKVNNYPNTKIPKDEIRGLLKQQNLTKELSNLVFKKTNGQILIRAYLKGQKPRYELLSSSFDINYQELKNYALYHVGIKDVNGYDISRASVIRVIESLDNSNLFFEKLLPLMSVDFVKNHELTVKPFPFKYIDEWIRMNC
ncbi:hypothetical protein [Microscilla marina]|uniref:Uncharacterized protein n=1 Tax=Microscilla marina ATCC 23134 TaxID=313606 RepID=A1ZEN3_MICM2|nr:hypothetical protein [Microscilla marina]EAY30985.1 hypothetical protein M23134_07392 [Microscilla marina ATCC 23134]